MSSIWTKNNNKIFASTCIRLNTHHKAWQTIKMMQLQQTCFKMEIRSVIKSDIEQLYTVVSGMFCFLVSRWSRFESTLRASWSNPELGTWGVWTTHYLLKTHSFEIIVLFAHTFQLLSHLLKAVWQTKFGILLELLICKIHRFFAFWGVKITHLNMRVKIFARFGRNNFINKFTVLTNQS